MDALAGLLDGPRAKGAFLLRLVLDSPYSIRIRDEAPLTVIAVVRGHMWIVPDEGKKVRLDESDVAIVRGPGPWTVADDPATPPQTVIHPGNHCETLYGESLEQKMALGVRTWGHNPDGENVVLVGVYEEVGSIGQRLLDELPSIIHIPSDVGCPAVPLLADEIGRDDCGQEAVLDRLLDLLLVSGLRAWFADPAADVPPWYRANNDPIVGRALRMLYNNPAHHWTVANLAAETGVSRAALARRFTDLVGEPPMTFLTEWRLTLAADLLREPDATVGAVARKVGYSTPFALSSAFKRVRGISPQQHRQLAKAG
jgi:AraC-like DNA-binding protein